ncbi:MAG: gamma-glutamylcyclotransferase [Azovibrio sp.]|nr:gamma-glutamylcyclotransferase [Azovibrio sp.]
MKLFVYGSLLNPFSAEQALRRPITVADLLPARLPGYRLCWDSLHLVHVDSLGHATLAAFLNIRPDPTGQCLGALLELNDEELYRLKAREKGYSLIPVQCQGIDTRPCAANTFMDERRPSPPLPPVLAAYLDKIRAGLAHFEPEFARAYLSELPLPTAPLLPGNYHFVDSEQRANTC